MLNHIVQRSITWIDDRTGFPRALQHALAEPIPSSAGWAQVFGSVALFLFLSQAFTGMLLAMNYSASAVDAYSSLSYIVHEVAAGKMIRGLHHWGSSLMLIVVAVHMCQVFVYGAYKKPREVTWLSGVVMLLFTLAFGLTGYLLPWDNKAYWGTVVTARLLGGAPFAGPYLENLIGATGGVGAITLARFYAFHTMLLPALMIVTVAAHVGLVRRHGVTPEFSSGISGRFYPKQAFRDVVAIFLAFVMLFCAAAFLDIPLAGLADPNDTSYIPRPEWYFLFLFQALKYFQGPLELVGSIGLPTLAVLTLFAIPFIDRGSVRRIRERTVAFAAVAVAVGLWAALTIVAVATTPPQTTRSHQPESASLPIARATSSQDPEAEARGAEIYEKGACNSCHKVNGLGGAVGPQLNGLRLRHSREWVREHFVHPAKLSPGSIMPPYPFSPEEQNAIIDYLFSLPDQ